MPIGHELRKTVTAVFCDLVGSTALGEQLDPEALRHVLGRYYAEMRVVLERYGGLVEKFIGDAVVAVFGVPLVHEDDALRAVRAAVEMRSALDSLNEELAQDTGVRVAVRIGMCAGEVVAGDLGPGASFASGDAVNVAARLEEAAGPGQILLGPVARRLLGDAVEVEELAPLELHGKTEPVAAFRLVSVAEGAEAIVRHFETRFVGREHELALLVEAFEEAVSEPGCRLVTVVGEPGIGKTRLLAEFAASVAGRARVLRGHCLSYGKGITYWPLAEIVHDLSGDDDLAVGLGSCLLGAEQAAQISDLILSAIGVSEREGSVEEVQWAVRRLLETLAKEKPLVVVLEDLHWAEPTCLQLVEYISGCSTGAPLLLLGAARDELLDSSPGWALPHPHSRLLPLEPLPEPEARTLVDTLTGRDSFPNALREQVVDAAGGNPLFLEQLVAVQAEDGTSDGELALPTTITALLAGRLDRLSAAERDVLERGAVEGVVFHRGTVTALLDGQAGDVGGLLLDAVRRNLIHSYESRFPGDDGYQFAHGLIRDAVYESMPKELRAQLHERFAGWLGQTPDGRSGEVEEIIGYHFEQAAHAKQELGRPDQTLAERAGDKLAAAGRRAFRRGDDRTAVPLLERALALTRPTRLDVHLELDLANALVVGPVEVERAIAIADAAAERARGSGDKPGEALARVVSAHWRLWAGAENTDELEALVRVALPLLEQTDDHAGLRQVWLAVGWSVCNMRGHFEDAAKAYEQALRHDRLAGDRRTGLPGGSLRMLSYGPRPAGEVLSSIDERLGDRATPLLLLNRARVLAMLGRFDEARQITADVSAQSRAFSDFPDLQLAESEIAASAGDHETAARHLRRFCDDIEEHAGRSAPGLLSYLARLCRELCALGQHDEAERLARQVRELAPRDDVNIQMLWRQAQALVHAHRGRHAEAEQLAREAVEIGERTDALNNQGDALRDLAQVLETAGHTTEAAEALEQALDRYRRKENLAMVAQIQPWLEQLRAATTA